MDIFEWMGETLSKAGKDLDKKAKELTGTAKLHANITQEELKIREQFRELGKLYFEQFKDAPHAEMEMVVAKIKESMDKIDKAKAELEEKKAKHRCPGCGSTVPKGSVFCNRCGCKMPEDEGDENCEAADDEPASASEASSEGFAADIKEKEEAETVEAEVVEEAGTEEEAVAEEEAGAEKGQD